MGQVLSHPIRSQLLQRRCNDHYKVASSEMQGCRMAMEDTHTIALRLSDRHPNKSLFGVFDGHAGDKASLYLEQEVYVRVGELEDPTKKEQLEQCMVDIDAKFLSQKDDREDGSTCVFAVVEHPESKEEKGGTHKVTVVNVGDSRALIVRTDGTCVSLTTDHKPETQEEKQRISDAGGTVEMNRVDGQLAMSRAIGDWQYKSDPKLSYDKQKVVPIPDVTKDELYSGDALLICCDGIVEQMTNEDAAKIIHENMQNHKNDPAEILGILFEASLKAGSKDNHSAILVIVEENSKYSRKDEFRAGPFNPFKGDPKFVQYYMEDAKKHGYEGDKLMKMAQKTEDSMPELKDMQDYGATPVNASGAAQFVQMFSQQPSDVKDKLMELLQGGTPVTIQQVGEDEVMENSSTIEVVEPQGEESLDTMLESEEGTIGQEEGSTTKEVVDGGEPKQKEDPNTKNT